MIGDGDSLFPRGTDRSAPVGNSDIKEYDVARMADFRQITQSGITGQADWSCLADTVNPQSFKLLPGTLLKHLDTPSEEKEQTLDNLRKNTTIENGGRAN